MQVSIKNSLTYSTLIILCLLIALPSALQASDVEEFEVGGLKVILKKSPKEVISVRLFIEGGTANYPKNKEGIETLTLDIATRGGTQSLSKTEFATKSEQIGASIGSSSSYDHGDIHMTAIKMFWDESWSLFADAILNPAFDPKEFKLIQEQLVAGAMQTESSPDDHLRNIAMNFAFEGGDYAKIPEGTAESLGNLTLEEVKSYYNKTVGKKRCFIVVVGNVDKADLTKKIQETLARMPEGTAAKKGERKLITEGGEYIENRDIATNYIRGVMSGPLASEPEAVPMQLGMAILRDRYFKVLRTQRSLTYAPAAFYARAVITNPYNVIYISTDSPAVAMELMVAEINSIKKEGFENDELTNKKQSFLTRHFMGQETSSSQSQTLGMAEMAGDWKLAEDFATLVNKVNKSDMDDVFNQYTKAIRWVYLGKEEDVNEGDFIQTTPVKRSKINNN